MHVVANPCQVAMHLAPPNVKVAEDVFETPMHSRYESGLLSGRCSHLTPKLMDITSVFRDGLISKKSGLMEDRALCGVTWCPPPDLVQNA